MLFQGDLTLLNHALQVSVVVNDCLAGILKGVWLIAGHVISN